MNVREWSGLRRGFFFDAIISIVYEVSIQRKFTADHALLIGGRQEAVHQHDWVVVVEVMGSELDDDGLLVDFHALEELLDSIISRFFDRNLNSTPPFDAINPTAERVAEYIGRCVAEGLGEWFGEGGGYVRLRAVRVTEAPGCVATYRPE